MENKLNVSLVVGSWKAYNENNERALGSNWLNMSDYDSIDEIIEELKKEGFTDEELEETFIQDYSSDIDVFNGNYDNTSIEEAFELLEKLDELDYDAETIEAFVEVEGNLDNIDDYEIYFYPGQTIEELAYDFMHDAMNIPEELEPYIDYEAYARNMSYDGFTEVSNGVIEIR